MPRHWPYGIDCCRTVRSGKLAHGKLVHLTASDCHSDTYYSCILEVCGLCLYPTGVQRSAGVPGLLAPSDPCSQQQQPLRQGPSGSCSSPRAAEQCAAAAAQAAAVLEGAGPEGTATGSPQLQLLDPVSLRQSPTRKQSSGSKRWSC